MSRKQIDQASGVKIKMLGNHGEYRNGETVTVDLDEANRLTGYGIAVLVPDEGRADEDEAAPAAAAGEGN